MWARPSIVCAAAVEGGGLCDAVIGVGKAAASLRTCELLLKSRPPWLLLVGVCGAYPGGPAVGELCVVGEDRLADEGVELAGGAFMGIAGMGLGDEGPFRGDVERSRAIAARLGCGIVAGATVSACSGCDERSRALAGRSGAQVETMEGAAVLLVCQHLGVPAVQLRCVSNRTGERAAAGWDLRGAVERLQAALRGLKEDYRW
ncbi:MAG: futalosine hydrolase [Myxococcales bacterium]|nr:futalosine hydrolase [Myxococcales bacterium]